MDNKLNCVWSWTICVILALLLGCGLARLWYTCRKISINRRVVHVWVALALSFFVLYDLCVYRLLVLDLPYTTTPVGAGRFVLDVVMAILIGVLLWRGMNGADWPVGGELVAILISWHVCAVIWHVMAHVERHRTPPWADYLPHLIFCSVYALAYALNRRAQRRSPQQDVPVLKRRFALVLSTLVICVSGFRLWQKTQPKRVSASAVRQIAGTWR
ncbi:MAG: hypothetical protein ACO1TE_06125 [Prosthecobacter sp.]